MKTSRLVIHFAALLAISIASCCSKPKEPEAPATPSGVTVQAGETSLSCSWDAVAGATSYRYVLEKSNGSQVKSNDVKGTSVTITGLSAGTKYQFKVCAMNGTLVSGYSGYVSATTTGSSDTPGSGETPGTGNTPGTGDTPGGTTDYYAAFEIPASEDADHKALAFPGADGGGMLTTGGRGGAVYHVTSLADTETDGTLRYGIRKASRPVTIVFDVAGIIELTSPLKIEKGDITIAGQTAPGDGICLKNYTFNIHADNVIVRFIRCRMGDEKKTEDDAMGAAHKDSEKKKNIIIDHCSMSWSTDECGSFYGNENFTLQYCILSEGLRNSVHEKGTHCYGGIWGGSNASFHHNLLAHQESRNPRFDHDYLCTARGPLHYYNNVVYNWGNYSAYGGESGPGAEPRQINMVNNYYKPGPATPSSKIRLLSPTTKCKNCNSTSETDVVPGKFYVDGNIMYGKDAMSADNWTGVYPDEAAEKDACKANAYQGTRPAKIQSAADAYTSVLAYAGASLKRDSVDERAVNDTKDGTATCKDGGNGSTNGFVDTQSAVGGWPDYKASAEETAKVKDSDHDGMPDWFEDQFGLDKSKASDGTAKTLDKFGRYTNVEMYFHYLVKDIIKGQNNK